MSWTHVVMPLSGLNGDLDDVSTRTGRDLRGAASKPTPTARQVLSALADAGCYGTLNFQPANESDAEFGALLRTLAPPSDSSEDTDLREISLQDSSGVVKIVGPDIAVECVSFRSAGDAVLTAAMALRTVMGDVLIADGGAGDSVCVIAADDDFEQVAAVWPW